VATPKPGIYYETLENRVERVTYDMESKGIRPPTNFPKVPVAATPSFDVNKIISNEERL